MAQVLLTLEDSEQRTRYLNARATLEALLSMKATPVINENDTVATAEIRYGDNDRLAARVAQMASADCLVLLSDVDGLYTADPNRDPTARFIEQVPRITPEIEAMAGRALRASAPVAWRPRSGRARIAVNAGCHMCIAAGHPRHPIRRIEDAVPAAPGLCRLRRRWPRASNGSPVPCGRPAPLRIDAGALRALAVARVCCRPA